ncbi:MAG TPA: KEOPS complex kinase/ATPase Bud32 [Candidatus Thalassarchaeaceae archaeon]|jgi:Kae1-associated kinase Bud32|nr:KEOPS complex kinase/ATPase Bud32 [Candidatus Thalassarchaeaceae archaeon]
MEGTSQWVADEILHDGAEARTIAGIWIGTNAVMKIRRPKGYRHPSLDESLTKRRLFAEARILVHLSNSEMPIPELLDFDEKTSTLVITRLSGEPLFNILRESKDFERVSKLMHSCGKLIRNLHSLGVSHGDLTTHNLLCDNYDSIQIIDFGLGRLAPEIEALGQDLQVLAECLSASHPSHSDAMAYVLKGYKDGNEDGLDKTEIITRFEEIRGRVRYHG